MNFLDRKTIEIVPPRRPLVGRVVVPGSKSITNRALLVAGLARGTSRINGALKSDDTIAMADALRAMAVKIDERDESTIIVHGRGGLTAPTTALMLGNAGTATRFLTAAAALVRGTVVIDGDRHMRKRPIGPLVDALKTLGVDAATPTGCPPVTVNGGGGFTGTRVAIDGSLSSQYVSALLMLAACGAKPVEVAIEGGRSIGGRGYIDITLAVMRHFGAGISPLGDTAWLIEPTGYRARDFVVEPDASSCTYLWAAGMLTRGKIDFEHELNTALQPDAKSLAFIRAFPRMPATIDGAQMQDSVPTLAVMAAFNQTPVRFTGIANLRVKECDRVRALATELGKIDPGLAVEEGDDLIVRGGLIGGANRARVTLHSWHDHRIAMGLSLAGLMIDGIVIDNPGCVAKTFPTYWDVLSGLGVGLI